MKAVGKIRLDEIFEAWNLHDNTCTDDVDATGVDSAAVFCADDNVNDDVFTFFVGVYFSDHISRKELDAINRKINIVL